MQEKTLLKLSLIVSITGIALLFFISVYAESNENFQLLGEGDFAVVRGQVLTARTSGNITFLRVAPEGAITAVIFGNDYLALGEGDNVEMRGVVEEYKGEKELIVEEMRKI